ncbi:uncharacterized protein LOC117299526 [Asterias rubens]|uniref:uncharacterized protein LOC117299526 n=1 Tax=Asterias rubens TaxID=7604 RepID=UPI001454FEC7|nr:uncharacterized protein LOC117299526 [Asterias rubens]
MKGYTLLALLVVVGCVSAYQDDEVALLERLLDLKRSQNLNLEEAPEERQLEKKNEPTLRELLRNVESLLNKRIETQEEKFAEQKRYQCGALFQCAEGLTCVDYNGTGYCV